MADNNQNQSQYAPLQSISGGGENEVYYTLDIDKSNLSAKKSDFLNRVQKLSRHVPKRPNKYSFKSLARLFAERLLDPVTKSEVVIGLDAQKGAGKSVSSLKLAEDVARELSLMEYGDTSHHLEYFNPLTNIAIITDESIHNVLKNLIKEHQVLILDDAGNSIGNRDAQTRSNKLIVKLMQTIRIKSCCFIISVPDLYMVDKQLRDLCTHHMHVEESFHELGFNLLSCRRIWQVPRLGKKELHLTARDCGCYETGSNSVVITRWKIGKPSEETGKLYDKLRLKLTEQQIRDTNKLLQKEREKSGLEDVEEDSETTVLNAKAIELAKDIIAGKVSEREASTTSGLTRYRLRKAVNLLKKEEENYKFEDINSLSGDLKP